MKFALSLCLAASMLVAASSYEQYIGNAKHPDHPGKCYHRDTKRPIAFDEVYRPTNTGECQKITCRSDYVLRIDSCPRFQVGDDCRVISGDLSQPYPRCCAQLDCRKRNGEREIRPTHNEYNFENQVYY